MFELKFLVGLNCSIMFIDMGLMVVFIILAVLGLGAGVWGFVLREKHTERFDETITSRGTGFLRGVFEKSRSKGIRTSFYFEYKIADFYKRLKTGDREIVIDALILFGFSAAVVFTFLAVGSGLVAGGEEWGWLIIGLVVLIVLFVTVTHIREARKS